MFNQLRNSIKKYFGISRTEANGILVLVFLLLLIISSPFIYRNAFQGGDFTFEADSVLLDSLIKMLQYKAETEPEMPNIDGPSQDTVFSFDPNEIDFSQMILLGFDTLIANRIIRFRNAGGRFEIKRDLLKIYHLPYSHYMKLKKYIRLPDRIKTLSANTLDTISGVVHSLSKSQKEMTWFDINNVDTTDLKAIYGIGSVLSNRIIKYRDLLGGYSNIDQLNDVYGLKGNSLANLKSVVYVDTLFKPDRIRVNFCEWSDLVKHPYINSRLANDIIQLRSTIGFLKNTSDLKKISYLNDSILFRLEPYIEF
jgi:DNA uptake protein ComE-like DNA-binding protein